MKLGYEERKKTLTRCYGSLVGLWSKRRVTIMDRVMNKVMRRGVGVRKKMSAKSWYKGMRLWVWSGRLEYHESEVKGYKQVLHEVVVAMRGHWNWEMRRCTVRDQCRAYVIGMEYDIAYFWIETMKDFTILRWLIHSGDFHLELYSKKIKLEKEYGYRL